MKLLGLDTLLVSLFLATTVRAECDESEEPKCKSGPTACENNSECCEGLGCFGYSFYKHCKKPPACLEEWKDCSGGTDCCEGMVCALMATGSKECQVKTIETVVIDTTGSVKDTAAPTSAPSTTPPEEINTRTTRIPDEPVNYVVACSVGDPHIYTFDGMNHDCQAEGEFTVVKSTLTRRHIQARYMHFSDINANWNKYNNIELSVTKGVAIQDEGADSPRVQLNVPVLPGSLAPNVIVGARVQFFVDGIQRDLNNGSGQDDKVKVTVNGKNIEVFYVASELKVVASMTSGLGGYMNLCVHLPDTDKTIGLFGSPDKDPSNDWMAQDGSALELAPIHERINFEGYRYCTDTWCIEKEEDSLFVYKEDGVDFEDHMHCHLPYGHSVEDLFGDVEPEVRALCGEDLMCILDARTAGIDVAKEAGADRTALKDTCNPAGGECKVADCCDGLLCVEGAAGQKECAFEVPKCARELATCSDSLPCCGTAVCEPSSEPGRNHCVAYPTCVAKWRDCFNPNIPCCGNSECITHPDGRKQCLELPQCMPEWGECTLGTPCCGNMSCLENPKRPGRPVCRNLPQCQSKEYRPCDGEDGLPADLGCCDGLKCIPHADQGGRKMCRSVPKCVVEFQSCEFSPCCEDSEKPLECVAFVDEHGRHAKQCHPKA